MRNHRKMNVRIGSGLVASLVIASAALAQASDDPPAGEQPRVTGVGGLFFKAEDGKALSKWYHEHLGIARDSSGVVLFSWRELERPEQVGYTVWSAFGRDTSYFDPSDKPFMFNYRVNDLHGLLAELKAAGVTIVGEVEEYEYGKFGWIMDPEGTKIELWEPPADPEVEAAAAEPGEAQLRAEVLAAVQQYYEDFSARDWEAFASRFHDGAIIATRWIPPGGETHEMMVTTVPHFVEQAAQGPGSQPIFEERMTDAEIKVQHDLAHAWVRYDAKFGTEDNLMEWTGVDAITLLRHEGAWKIVSLAFAPEPQD